MSQDQSSCFDLFFDIWLKVFQGVGLVLLNFDVKRDEFYLWKFSNVYCIVIGVLIAIICPFVLLTFGSIMVDGMSSFSFTVFVSLGSQTAFFVFTLLSYYKQHGNRFKIRDSLNELVYFYRGSKQTYREYEVNVLGMYQRDFIVSVLIKVSSFIINNMMFYFLLKDRDVPSWLSFMSYPFIASMAICNQFFLGTLIVDNFLAIINQKFNAILTKVSYYHEKVDDEELEMALSKAFYVHSITHKFHASLSTYFSSLMLYNVLNNYFTIALTSFQIFTVALAFSRGYDPGFDVASVITIGSMNVVVMSIDAAFHMCRSARCNDRVSSFEVNLNHELQLLMPFRTT